MPSLNVGLPTPPPFSSLNITGGPWTTLVVVALRYEAQTYGRERGFVVLHVPSCDGSSLWWRSVRQTSASLADGGAMQ